MALLARFRVALALLALLSLVACGGGGGSSSSSLPATGGTSPSPAPTSSSGTASAFTCPTSDTVSSVASAAQSSGIEARKTYHKGTSALTLPVLAVSYRIASIANPKATIDARVASFGATEYGEYRYTRTGYATRLLHVVPAAMANAEAALRATPGVAAVSVSRRFSPMSVSGAYLGDDPYFVGASGTSAPLYQTSNTEGQWDMHVEQLEHAFDYSQSSNGSGITNANALGSTSAKLAIIDTGEDVTHPELKLAHIVRTECFITNEAGTAQSTGTYVTDEAGHGTDVTGIAEASPTNDYGFVGDAGGVSLMLYRVFPTPDDNCANPDSQAAENDPQCGAADTDIASAIDDAVSNGANVISMSLGGSISNTDISGCTSPGVDADPIEGNAVANAIASGVIVVAAAGNSGGEGISDPACDSGVIAVGASAYNDGQPNGSGYTGPNSEYVASYSQYGSVSTADSTSSWGIVAPGGDDASDNDDDYLHWIENIWTTTPYMSSPSDMNFVGLCSASSEFGEAGNCRAWIAGTSMATPHVAGAAALILSVNAAYQSPSKMFQLLCTTADDIGDPHEGCGRLNVYRAMATALGDPHPPS